MLVTTLDLETLVDHRTTLDLETMPETMRGLLPLLVSLVIPVTILELETLLDQHHFLDLEHILVTMLVVEPSLEPTLDQEPILVII